MLQCESNLELRRLRKDSQASLARQISRREKAVHVIGRLQNCRLGYAAAFGNARVFQDFCRPHKISCIDRSDPPTRYAAAMIRIYSLVFEPRSPTPFLGSWPRSTRTASVATCGRPTVARRCWTCKPTNKKRPFRKLCLRPVTLRHGDCQGRHRHGQQQFGQRCAQ